MQLLIFFVNLPGLLELFFSLSSKSMAIYLCRSSSKCLSLYHECSHEEQLRAKRWLSSVEFVSSTQFPFFSRAEPSELSRAQLMKNGSPCSHCLMDWPWGCSRKGDSKMTGMNINDFKVVLGSFTVPRSPLQSLCGYVAAYEETVMYMCLVWTVQHGGSPVGAAARKMEEEVGVTHHARWAISSFLSCQDHSSDYHMMEFLIFSLWK